MINHFAPKIGLYMTITHTTPPPDVCELIQLVFGENVRITMDDCTYFMFYHNGQCVASSGIVKLNDGSYRLHTDCVHPDYRRMGIGTCMYMIRIEYIKRVLNTCRIELLIEHGELGSKLMGSVIESGSFPFQQASVDARFMKYKLGPDKRPTVRELHNVTISPDVGFESYVVDP